MCHILQQCCQFGLNRCQVSTSRRTTAIQTHRERRLQAKMRIHQQALNSLPSIYGSASSSTTQHWKQHPATGSLRRFIPTNQRKPTFSTRFSNISGLERTLGHETRDHRYYVNIRGAKNKHCYPHQIIYGYSLMVCTRVMSATWRWFEVHRQEALFIALLFWDQCLQISLYMPLTQSLSFIGK